MFEQTLEYAKEREAFGRPIGKFQAIRHKFAEMATKIEAAKQFTYSTAWRFANGEYPVREISMAKLYASRMGCEVADECIQIHGGYGYMKEYEIERAYRDVRLNRIGAGTDEIMLEVIGRSLRALGPAAAFRPAGRCNARDRRASTLISSRHSGHSSVVASSSRPADGLVSPLHRHDDHEVDELAATPTKVSTALRKSAVVELAAVDREAEGRRSRARRRSPRRSA